MSNILVTVPTTGTSVAVDIVSSVGYQNVKLVAGQTGDVTPIEGTTATPVFNAGGMVVRVAGIPDVAIVNGASVQALGVALAISNGTTISLSPNTYVVGSTGQLAPSNFGVAVRLADQSVQVSGTVQVSGVVSTVATILTVLGTLAVNVVAGGAGGGSVTTAPPSISQSGQAVWIVGGQSTSAFPVWVTGTVAAGAGTTVVSVQGAVPVTTQASVSVTGLPVWWNPTAQVVVSGLVGHSITGSVNIVSNVTVTGSVALSTPVSISSIVPVTTAASVSVSGFPVWLNPTQQVVVSGLVGHSITGSVNIVSNVTVTGSVALSTPVSISSIVPVTTAASVSVSGLPVWLNPTQAVNIGSIVSTVLVNVVAGGAGGGSVTTAPPSISQSGQAIWIVGGQSTTAFPVVVTGTVTAGAGTTVISIQNIVGVTTQASVSVTGLPVWLNPTQAVNVGSIASTVNVAIVAGAGGGGSVTTAAPSISATGQIVYVVGGQSTSALPVYVSQINTVVVSGQVIQTTTQASGVTGALIYLAASQTVMVDILDVAAVTTAASVSVSGFPVWLNPTQTIAVSGQIYTASIATGVSIGQVVIAKDFARQPVMIMVTSTAIAQSAAMYLMTIWTNGTVAAAATTAWAVPAGKVFRALNLMAAMTTSAVVGGTVQFVVLAATATASMVSGSLRTQGFQLLGQGVVTALPVQVGPMWADADTPGGTTVGIAIIASTAAVLQNVIVQGWMY